MSESAEVSEAPIFLQGPKGYFILFDYVISILAILGNGLILQAVLKVQFDLTGYRQFLISLAISDLYICFVNIFTFMHSALMMYYPNPDFQKCGADILRSMQFCGFFANLLNLCGMSVDHFIGIVYPLRYCDFMSPKIARIAVLSIWIVSFIIGFADFPISLGIYLADQNASGQTTPRPFNVSWSQTVEPITFTSAVVYNGEADYSSPGIDLEPSAPLLRFGRNPTDNPATESSAENRTSGPGDNLDNYIMSADLGDILSSLMGGNLQKEFGIEVNDTTKDQLKNIMETIEKPKTEQASFCTTSHPNRGWLEFSVMTMTIICFLFLSICYGRIFKEVFGHVDAAERNTRKLIVTTFILLGAFTICWMPFMVFEFIMVITLYVNAGNPSKTIASSASLFMVNNMFNSLLICAPLIDPLIYSARMRIIRRYLLMRYKKLMPCCAEYIEKMVARRPTFGMTTGPTQTSFAHRKTSSAVTQHRLTEANGGHSVSSPLSPNKDFQYVQHEKHDKHSDPTSPLIGGSESPGKRGSAARPPAIYTNRYRQKMRELDAKERADSLKTTKFDAVDTPKFDARRHSSLHACGSSPALQMRLFSGRASLKPTKSQDTFMDGRDDAQITLLNAYTVFPRGSLENEPSPLNIPNKVKIRLSSSPDDSGLCPPPDCLLATPERSEMTNSAIISEDHPKQPKKVLVDDSVMTDEIRVMSPGPIEFDSSHDVLRAFKGHASRLMDFSEPSSTNAIILAQLARKGRPASDLLPRKRVPEASQSINPVLLGKSPSLGDVSTPVDDLLVVTTNC